MGKIRVAILMVLLAATVACSDASDKSASAPTRNIDTLRPAPTTGGGRVLVHKDQAKEATTRKGTEHLEVFKKQLREQGVDPANIDDDAVKRAAMGWR